MAETFCFDGENLRVRLDHVTGSPDARYHTGA